MGRDPITRNFEAMQASPVEQDQAVTDWANPAVQDYQEGGTQEPDVDVSTEQGGGVFAQIGEAMDKHPNTVYGAAILGGAGIIWGADQLNIGSAGADGHVPAAHVRPAPEGFGVSQVRDGKVSIPHSIAAKASESEPTSVHLSMTTVEAEAWPKADKAVEASDASASAAQTLGHNALKKICVKEGLKKPVLRRGDLRRNREKQLGSQGWWNEEAVHLLPSECNGEFKRFTWVKTEIRNRGKGWRTSLPWGLYIKTNKGVLGDKNDLNWNGQYGNKVDSVQMLDVDFDGPGATYKCGGSARVKIKNRIKDLDTGKFVAGRQWKYKAKVKPAC